MRPIILQWTVTHSPQPVCFKHAPNHTTSDGDTFTTARVFDVPHHTTMDGDTFTTARVFDVPHHATMDSDTFTTARVFEACAPSYYHGR